MILDFILRLQYYHNYIRNPLEKLLCNSNDTWQSGGIEQDFLKQFELSTNFIIKADVNGKLFTPESHDILMAKTHLAAAMGAQQLKVYIDRAKDIPDHLIPNSFRLMREFVKTLEDMPSGTMESILANQY